MLRVEGINGVKNRSTINFQESANVSLPEKQNRELLANSLDAMASMNAISFKGKKQHFKLGLSTEELEKRTSKEYFDSKKMLDINAPEYEALAEGDKKAIQHLVQAADILDKVYLKQDNLKNIPFMETMEKKAKEGDNNAKMTLELFNAQKGINAVDRESNKISLILGEKETPGKAFYPATLEVKEFHETLEKMLEQGKIREVKQILKARTIVVRDRKELRAIDFTQAFEDEFKKAAKELRQAAKHSTNKDFNEFLKAQAKALVKNNPMIDATADKKWATLQDTPLEFTITRENYEDELTGTIAENEHLTKLLEKYNIIPVPKDSIGVRVGIVNKAGTEKLLEIKKYLPILAKEMPFADKYEQNISSSLENVKQTMVDVDLVTMTGDSGAYRGGITIAENLPNDDKLSLAIGGGRRNVYHRQIRKAPNNIQEKLNAILDKEIHQFYEFESDHWFTIGHENGHSLGPKSGAEALGKYKSIIEENKADMISIAMLDKLEELGMYNSTQKKQMITTFIVENFLKAKPVEVLPNPETGVLEEKLNFTQPHRIRSVMQTNYLMKNNAIRIDEKGICHIDYEKVVPTARKMLEEIIDCQMSGDFAKGEKYVLENFVWTDGMETIAQKLKGVNKFLNGFVDAPLAKALLKAAR